MRLRPHLSVLDSELATILTDALSAFDIPYALTITRNEVSGPPFDPVITPIAHSCQGWRDQYSAQDLINTAILATDVKAFVVASSLDIVPSTADTLTLNGTVYSIMNVSADPATACFIIQARA